MYSRDLGSLDVCDVESALAWVLATLAYILIMSVFTFNGYSRFSEGSK